MIRGANMGHRVATAAGVSQIEVLDHAWVKLEREAQQQIAGELRPMAGRAGGARDGVVLHLRGAGCGRGLVGSELRSCA